MKLLLDATTIDLVAQAIKKVFAAIKKCSSSSTYPVLRTLDLAACTARDFDEQLKKIINQQPLLKIEYQQYRNLQKEFESLQKAWEEAIDDFSKGISKKISGSIGAQNAKIA